MSDIHNQREIENMQAEIDRLRQILENIQQARVSQGKAIIDANNEIERLRAALREIVILDDEPQCCGRGIASYDNPPECCGDPERGIDRAQSIARAAIGQLADWLDKQGAKL